MQAGIQIPCLRGGRYDVADGTTGRAARRAQRMGAFVGDEAKRTADMFFSKGAEKLANPTKSPFLRQSVATNLNPRGLTRLGSVSQLTGQQSTGFYTPFQAVPRAMNYIAKKSAGVRNAFGIAEGDNAYSGGVLGRMTSMSRMYKMESQIANLQKIKDAGGTLTGRQEAKFGKLTAQRAQAVQNIARVQNFTAPFLTSKDVINMARLNPRGAMGGQTAAERLAQARAARAGIIDDIAKDPMKAISSTMTGGKISNAITSYYAGTLNPNLMTAGQQLVANNVIRGTVGFGSKGTAAFAEYLNDFGTGGKYAGGAFKQMAGGAKMFGMAGKYIQSGGSKMVAAKFAGMGAMRAGAAMIPGLNVLATASLLYDVGKGIGKLAVAGQNFAKDAVKSMQGSINKPLFGTGFVDNEVSASSRSRGVMAIQNSRLNARSLLGSEAAMMAAHFG